ncbi:carboxyl transferase domain-containing protein [Streptosporangium sp. NPDC051023]|uniref:carboxyl transferase domain-containing protein n=1 Tax=Streptosporangium sp. NPDC051023 TaxID=3155410 RepID=UPI00344C24E6
MYRGKRRVIGSSNWKSSERAFTSDQAQRPPRSSTQRAGSRFGSASTPFFDRGSFAEVEAFCRHRATRFRLERRRPRTDGVVAGSGRVFGRDVMVYAHDFRIFGGTFGEAHAEKIHKVMDLAEAVGVPLVV